MLAPILAWPAAHRAACRMQADDLNRAFASYASEARRGGLLWEGLEPDPAFAPDEVRVRACGERSRESARHRDAATVHVRAR